VLQRPVEFAQFAPRRYYRCPVATIEPSNHHEPDFPHVESLDSDSIGVKPQFLRLNEINSMFAQIL
jgi:hypothetical protein